MNCLSKLQLACIYAAVAGVHLAALTTFVRTGCAQRLVYGAQHITSQHAAAPIGFDDQYAALPAEATTHGYGTSVVVTVQVCDVSQAIQDCAGFKPTVACNRYSPWGRLCLHKAHPIAWQHHSSVNLPLCCGYQSQVRQT